MILHARLANIYKFERTILMLTAAGFYIFFATNLRRLAHPREEQQQETSWEQPDIKLYYVLYRRYKHERLCVAMGEKREKKKLEHIKLGWSLGKICASGLRNNNNQYEL